MRSAKRSYPNHRIIHIIDYYFVDQKVEKIDMLNELEYLAGEIRRGVMKDAIKKYDPA